MIWIALISWFGFLDFYLIIVWRGSIMQSQVVRRFVPERKVLEASGGPGKVAEAAKIVIPGRLLL